MSLKARLERLELSLVAGEYGLKVRIGTPNEFYKIKDGMETEITLTEFEQIASKAKDFQVRVAGIDEH